MGLRINISDNILSLQLSFHFVKLATVVRECLLSKLLYNTVAAIHELSVPHPPTKKTRPILRVCRDVSRLDRLMSGSPDEVDTIGMISRHGKLEAQTASDEVVAAKRRSCAPHVQFAKSAQRALT